VSTGDVVTFLGGEQVRASEWRFALGRHLHGAFGGASGGVIAACGVLAARDIAPGRAASSIDVRFLRSLPAGSTRVVATPLHAGRSLTSVSIDVLDEQDRLGARATVSFVDRESLHPLEVAGPSPAPHAQVTYGRGTPWRAPSGLEIPILRTLEPRILGRDGRGVAIALRVPWAGQASAEAVCLAADLCVGPPVAGAVSGHRVPHPNPDLSLRLAAELTTDELVAIGLLERVHAGLAIVRIEVRAGVDLVAIGVSSSMLLGTGQRG
jgi:acyl-coenzyme A thioesterase PaaI-like protein